ncbi:glucose-6-phosphate isomerase [Planktosalinus lacus]|uniref:Glucose-6-phosphate isomerase n=1 Tax=Planktosalinus lacus TaxID=1526573 RepID=A0A8J2Y9Z7_9FLAO|nr:glucose-6-phosphate isomerase [Planktosalinus lacus]GGD95347.1 glucose-6-phosphate isomerase [Planktosalinus lacus]
MSLPKVNPVTTNAWTALNKHFAEIKDSKMQQFFSEDSRRAQKYSISWEDFYFDYSKNRITDKTLELLLQLAEEVKLGDAIEAQFSGEQINETEGRAVLHTALRDFKNLPNEVSTTLQKMKQFSESVISGKLKGHTGKAFTDVVNIGIGGSDLGPDMVTEALAYYKNHLNVHFMSNVDGDHVQETLKKLDRETTLFIVVSKSFTTQETLTNAETVRNWFLKTVDKEAVSKHFVAVSTNLGAIEKFGIHRDHIFPMWDWVGGRFSLWGTVGLSICFAVGYANFEKLLKGASQMDIHFKSASFDKNIPVILALLSVWYNNFFKSETEAVVPYSQYLSKLIPYLQQAVMESNGKQVDRNGHPVTYETGTIVWGSTGTNAQHAFFQLLHQGTKLIPVDFIAFAKALHKQDQHQEILLANCFAQSEAFLNGTVGEEIENPYRFFDGNRPSNTILIKQLTPENLGALIALYEHKLFVQGVIWNIFSFDQWGVELGKKLATGTLDYLRDTSSQEQHPSTLAMINFSKKG